MSLTEEPEFEVPVALNLVNRFENRTEHQWIAEIDNNPIDPYAYKKRKSNEVDNIGGANVPRVIIDASNQNSVLRNTQRGSPRSTTVPAYARRNSENS